MLAWPRQDDSTRPSPNAMIKLPKSAPSKRAHSNERPLLDDIRLLGRILGDVIREQEGVSAFELIEQIRTLSVAFRRHADTDADKTLKKLLKGLSNDQTVSVIRAFTYFSHLANLAEDRHHIRRRAFHERAGQSQEGSIEMALARLRQAGISSKTIADTLATSFVSPVLTAHPTEVQRKSILDAERAIAELLSQRDDIRLRAGSSPANPDTRSGRELNGNAQQIRARVIQLWQTRLLRHSKLTVADEVENALSYYETTFLHEIPRIYAALENELEQQHVHSFLRMGQWIGGDRDGNPNVNAQTLVQALRRQAEVVLRHYLTEVHYLGGELSISAMLAGCLPAMQALADASPDRNEHRKDEPYRRALIGVYARLAAALHDLTGGEASRHAVPPQNAYPNAQAFLTDLLTIEAAVLPGKGNLKLTGKLGEVMQESANLALSYVRSRALRLGLETDFYQKLDIHIHVPEGAIPKDGPSAGITIATTLVSALLKAPVRHEIAMTGEITLRGRILPIGGLTEKLLAAKRGNITHVLIPKDNERNLADVPANIRKSLVIECMENVDDVLERAIVLKEGETLFKDLPVPIVYGEVALPVDNSHH